MVVIKITFQFYFIWHSLGSCRIFSMTLDCGLLKKSSIGWFIIANAFRVFIFIQCGERKPIDNKQHFLDFGKHH